MSSDQQNPDSDRSTASLSSLGFFCLLGLFFLAGGLFGIARLQPIKFLAEGFLATNTLFAEATQTRPDLLQPIAYPGSGVVVYDPARASAGLTVVQGLLPGGPQVRLIDMNGRELHRWIIDFSQVWPNPKHVEPPENIPISALHSHTQGFHIRPDGSLLVNIDEKGAANFDRCGRILWTVDRMTHHMVVPSEDGGFYLPAHNPLSQTEDRLLTPLLTREELTQATIRSGTGTEDLVLKIDSKGRVLQQFSVLAAIHDAGKEAALHLGWTTGVADPTHLNDIEVVTPALAKKIVGVAAGDLLVSLRNMDMLAILDRNDGKLKWRRFGPWVLQHDPDITPDGDIEIFNNRSDVTGGLQEGSQILRYDPADNSVKVIFPKGQQDTFRSSFMGSHQRLPNGNEMIVESTGGRVFEETPAGDVVWSYVVPYDSEYASLIEDAQRVPEDYFTVTDWSCN